MNNMETWEADLLLDNLEFSYFNEWEICRSIMYVTAQVNSKKKLSPKDVIKFKWDASPDTEIEEEHNTNISNDDIKRLKALAQKFTTDK